MSNPLLSAMNSASVNLATGLCLSFALSSGWAQVSWDAGGGSDHNWTNFDNWSSGASPAGEDVLFPDSNKTSATTPNNIVDEDFTIRSLTYQNTGTGGSDWQVTQIGEGVTLTLADGSAPTTSLVVGGMAGANGARLTTLARIEGEGGLVINQASANVSVGNTGGNSTNPLNQGYATLDLSGLSRFQAVVNRFNVGFGRGANGTALLAEDSEITANALIVGDTGVGEAGGKGTLLLGQSTVLHVNTIKIGAVDGSYRNLASGEISFQDGLDGATLVLRGSDGGTTRANITVGDQGNDITGNRVLQTAELDLTGGTVDAMIGTLTIGRARGSSTSQGMTASVSMASGTMNVTSVRVGILGGNASAAAQKLTSTLNVLGGSLIAGSLSVANNTDSSARQALEGLVYVANDALVTVAGGIVLGNQAASDGPELKAILDIAGGSVSVGGNISEGAGSGPVASSLKLDGGSLNMNGYSISVDSAVLASGTLSNVGQFRSGADLVKTSEGTLVVAGTNSYTGATTVSAGTMLIDGTLSSTSGVTVQDGAALGGSGVITDSATTLIEAGGTLQPGTGTLAMGALILDQGASLSIGLSGAGEGDYGRALVESLTILDGNLQISLNFAPITGQTFLLIENSDFGGIVGGFLTVNGMAFGPDNTFSLEYNSQAYQFQLSYTGNGSSPIGGNDLVLSVIPEPGSVTLLLVALMGFVIFPRGRKGSSLS